MLEESRDEQDFFPDCQLKSIISKINKNDIVGFMLGKKHFTIKRDE